MNTELTPSTTAATPFPRRQPHIQIHLLAALFDDAPQLRNMGRIDSPGHLLRLPGRLFRRLGLCCHGSRLDEFINILTPASLSLVQLEALRLANRGHAQGGRIAAHPLPPALRRVRAQGTCF